MGPLAEESEKAFLGELLAAGADQAIDIIESCGLVGRDFWTDKHQVIFSSIHSLASNGRPPDVVAVLDHLRRNKRAERAGQALYLAELSGSYISIGNAKSHGQIVRERSIQRQAIELGKELESGMSNGVDTMAAILTKSRQLESMAALLDVRESCRVSDALQDAWQDVKARQDAGSDMLGPGLGIGDVDWAMRGLTPGDLHVIAGRPGMGKTSLACQWALNTARKGKGVLFVTLEMNRRQLAMRLLGIEGELNIVRLSTIPREDLTPAEQQRIDGADVRLRTYPMRLVDNTATTPASIMQEAKAMKTTGLGLGLIVVDYLQLMLAPGFGPSDRVQAVSYLSRELKKMALVLDVPVLALSQLNRSVESRKDKRPMMSDLRESGQVEADASTVCLLYRDDYYDLEAVKGLAELIIAKNRFGPTKTIEITWVDKYTRFYPYDWRQQQ